MMASGQPRRSAYFSWLPNFFQLPWYISARMPAARSVLHEFLVAAERFRVAVHDGDQHRRDDIVLAELAEVLQGRHQPRDADGKARRRHVLPGEALDQPVIAPAAADRAENTSSPFSLVTLN
jgi:hypothetical protein